MMRYSSWLQFVFLSVIVMGTMQNCFSQGGGTTAGDPLSTVPGEEILVGLSPYDDYVPSEVEDTREKVQPGEYLKSLRMCIQNFYARSEDGTWHSSSFSEEGGREIEVLPDGTILGFLEDQDFPAGEYIAALRVSNRCGWWHRYDDTDGLRHRTMMIFENSYGTFGWRKHGGLISGLKMTRTTIGENRFWAADVQPLVDTLAGIQSSDDITCSLELWTPECVPEDPPGTEPHVKRLQICFGTPIIENSDGDVIQEGRSNQDAFLYEDGTLEQYFFEKVDWPEGTYTMHPRLDYGCGLRIHNSNSAAILWNGHGIFRIRNDRMRSVEITLERDFEGENIWSSREMADLYEAAKHVESDDDMLCLFYPDEDECQ